ncbi:MAG: SDR family NAD(P)-dependent oxidoreductase, partial [Candidatus Dadabacteria bacterium]
MKLLEGKTALITGGGSGIGRETARLFAEEGANVVITGRKEENLIEAAGTDNGAISYLVNDVSKEEDCKAAVEFTLDKFGKLDILFNNAG